MSSAITALIISILDRYPGPNSYIIKFFPNTLDVKEKFINEKFLPFGALSNQFLTNTLGSNKFLIFTFEIQKEGCNDLASIGFLLEKDIVVENLQLIVEQLVKHLDSHNLLTFKIIEKNLSNIFDGINNKLKIKIGNMIFDVNSVLIGNNIELKLNPRKTRGYTYGIYSKFF